LASCAIASSLGWMSALEVRDLLLYVGVELVGLRLVGDCPDVGVEQDGPNNHGA
jgi:hypothetical protein